ncbi:MAG: transporter substrate-binding domain-containing protein [Candidatus Thiodiazotropha sp. (ex Semelilucina semeliformis)]|nr:transporter substrate-binding domain-containing protein [Candidatus Thiodiazotropha sp. (ex Semelilucina semeliformis)]
MVTKASWGGFDGYEPEWNMLMDTTRIGRHPLTILTSSITCLAVFLSLSIIAGCSSEDQVNPLKPLRVATGNWQPFVGEELPHGGPLATMISTIFVDLGYVPEFQFYDWPMVEIHLETGYPSLAFPFIKSDERVAKGFRFSNPLHTFDYVLFYHKDRAEEFSTIESFGDLHDMSLKIGRIRGYAKLTSISGDDDYVEVPSAVAGFGMLRRSKHDNTEDGKRIDFLLESKSVGLDILKSRHVASDKGDFMFLGQAGREELISKVSLSIMVSPKMDASILSEINDAIEGNKRFFDGLRSKMVASNESEANLVSPTGTTIFAYEGRLSDNASFIIPRNSQVLIVEWGEAYTNELHSNSSEFIGFGKSQVKLLNGPSKGRVVWVKNEYISLRY